MAGITRKEGKVLAKLHEAISTHEVLVPYSAGLWSS